MINPPTEFIRETKDHWVLADSPSKSNPEKTYEIRVSKRDGRCYCQCLAWIFKARKGDGKCKHILAYIARGFEVTVMSIVDFLEIKRARPIMDPVKKLSDTVDVKRRII